MEILHDMTAFCTGFSRLDVPSAASTGWDTLYSGLPNFPFRTIGSGWECG